MLAANLIENSDIEKLVCDFLPEYDYEKIECMMQGVRDYIKFLKRGYGRTAHLTTLDIRNGRMDRETAAEMVRKFDGKRPHSVDVFLEILGVDEETFMSLIEPNVVAPHVIPSAEEMRQRMPNKPVSDFDRWPRIFGNPEKDVPAGE